MNIKITHFIFFSKTKAYRAVTVIVFSSLQLKMTNAQFPVVDMAEAMETAEVVEMAEAITLTFVSEISKVC